MATSASTISASGRASPAACKAVARQKAAFAFIFVTVLLDMVSFGVIIPVFPQLILKLQGGDITGPKLICIDLQPATTTQAPDRNDILNVGGFSDAVFGVVASFLDEGANRFVTEVEWIEL